MRRLLEAIGVLAVAAALMVRIDDVAAARVVARRLAEDREVAMLEDWWVLS